MEEVLAYPHDQAIYLHDLKKHESETRLMPRCKRGKVPFLTDSRNIEEEIQKSVGICG